MPQYILPDLDYDFGALEPHINGQIMELHHGKHHKAYVDKANETLDTMAKDEGKKEKLNEQALNLCIEKQDDSVVKASMKVGSDLGIEATPVLYINGEKLEGAYPIEYVYRMIDNALIAAGQTPPPPVPLPSLNASPSAGAQAQPGSPQ